MPSLRVSATDVDALRRFISPPEGMEIELADLLRQLRKEEPPSEAMMAGTALHKLLEDAPTGELFEVDVDGYRFDFLCDGEIDLAPIREIKATRDYEIAGCCVTLVGKVDALHGKRVDDHKFTSRYDAERFLSSYQWRIYLDVFDASEFRWNVFEGRESGPKHYIISHLHQLRMHAYPGMHDDIVRSLTSFVGFARDFLPERFTCS